MKTSALHAVWIGRVNLRNRARLHPKELSSWFPFFQLHAPRTEALFVLSEVLSVSSCVPIPHPPNLPSSILCASNPEVLARAPTPHGSSRTHSRRFWKEMAYDCCGNFLINQQPTKELIAADAWCEGPWAVSVAGRQYFTLLISQNETTLKLAKCTWRPDRWRGMCSVAKFLQTDLPLLF